MENSEFLAFDLGAESGRAISGKLDKGKISLEEIHRFPTQMMRVHEHLKWNIYRMYEDMFLGLEKYVSENHKQPESIAVDTWGVDFGLLGPEGNLLDLPFCYRDSRTDNLPAEFFKLMPRFKLYENTGIQIMQINSVFQLFSLARSHSPLLKNTSELLFIPDLFNYLLSGVKKSEFSFATTSQLFNPKMDNWDPSIFECMDVNIGIMQDIVQPGTQIGFLHPALGRQSGIKNLPVVSVASHDTGSAIAAIPAEGEDWAYISSGTWSLMGIESKEAIISEKTLSYNITNEGGVNKTFRVLKNIMGLWLLQQCRAVWGKENYSYDNLVKISLKAKPFAAFIDPDHSSFLNPVSMPEAIKKFCEITGQKTPADVASISRTVLECLALKYRYTLDQLREVSPYPINKIYIIGGGVRNEALCRFTANACGIPVITGPSEGTALGNIMVQAMAMNKIGNLKEIRQIVKNSFPSAVYEPVEHAAWEDAYNKFRTFIRPEF